MERWVKRADSWVGCLELTAQDVDLYCVAYSRSCRPIGSLGVARRVRAGVRAAIGLDGGFEAEGPVWEWAALE
jgi:hypothetical protein